MIVGLDIGTNHIRVAIGELNDSGGIEIAGTASRKSVGLRNGVIVNIEDAAAAIKEAVENAEQNAGAEVTKCAIGIGGTQIEGLNQRGITPVTEPGRPPREVTRGDIERAIDNARAVFIPQDRELLHVVAQSFTVDNLKNIKDPTNMMCARLEADVHVITASKTTIQNIKRCVSRAGYESSGIMLKTLAATQAVVHDDEMDLGSILIDMGAGTTDVLVLLGGAPVCTVSIPVGGNLVTNDIAIVKGIPVSAAEKIKIESGCCFIDNIEIDREVIIPGVGGRDPELTTQTELCTIIQPRVEEIFSMVRSAVISNSNIRRLSGNIILTGGGAQMEGVVECAQAVFGTSAVRIGTPEKLGGAEAEYRRPEFATVIGLVIANKNAVQEKNGRKNKKLFSSEESGKKENLLTRLKKSFF
ncbi:cell division protein FtsA [Treponema socranskii subsp. paredis ATCC 35535]|nr:cell division protein FtsA [Treponema socranskii subsp. paredis ATCC 35535]